MPEFIGGNRDKVELFLDESKLQEVLRRKKPTGYFWCDMTDMFLDDYPMGWVMQCFAVMALTPQHIHMVLTKRPERMHEMLTASGVAKWITDAALKMVDAPVCLADRVAPIWPLPNLYLGVSVENQKYADERIPPLLQTPAAVRFVSYEPALGPVDFTNINVREHVFAEIGSHALVWRNSPNYPTHIPLNTLTGWNPGHDIIPPLDWIIFGGESGRNARPCNIQWARDVRDQCKAAGVPYFFKQMGTRPYEDMGFDDIHYLRFRDRKGGDPSEWPEQDRVREFPR